MLQMLFLKEISRYSKIVLIFFSPCFGGGTRKTIPNCGTEDFFELGPHGVHLPLSVQSARDACWMNMMRVLSYFLLYIFLSICI